MVVELWITKFGKSDVCKWRVAKPVTNVIILCTYTICIAGEYLL